MAERAAYVHGLVGDHPADLADLVRLRLDWSRAQGLEQTADFAHRPTT